MAIVLSSNRTERTRITRICVITTEGEQRASGGWGLAEDFFEGASGGFGVGFEVDDGCVCGAGEGIVSHPDDDSAAGGPAVFAGSGGGGEDSGLAVLGPMDVFGERFGGPAAFFLEGVEFEPPGGASPEGVGEVDGEFAVFALVFVD